MRQPLAAVLLLALAGAAGAQDDSRPAWLPAPDSSSSSTGSSSGQGQSGTASGAPSSGDQPATQDQAGDQGATAPADSQPADSQPADAQPAGTDASRPENPGEGVAPQAPSASDVTGTIPVPQAAAPAPEPSATQLDEVVVTAQKVKQPLRRVPISVTSLGGDFISDTGAATLADVSLYVPNVRVDADDLGSPQVFIRGFGTNSFNPSFEASVAFVEDDVYFGRPGYFTEAMFDIDRVEVLRGPQGTLFGKNSVAGVFNVVSREPDENLSADLRVFGGTKGEQRVEGGAGGMLTDWLGARVSALKWKQDGDLYNTFLNRYEEGRDQLADRAKVVLLPGAGLRSELMYVKSDTKAPFWAFQLKNLDADTRAFLQGYDPNIEDDPKDFRTEFDTPGWIDKGSTTYAVKTDWDLDELGPVHGFVPTLVVADSKFHIDQLNELDVSPADIARLDDHERHHQKSAELRVTGKLDQVFGMGHGLEFVAGGYWYQSSYTLLANILSGKDLGAYTQTKDFCQLATADPNSNPNGTGCTSSNPTGIPVLGQPTAPLVAGDLYRLDYDQDVTSTAFFGQATWYFTERLAVTPGVRVTKEKKRADVHGNGDCQGKAIGQPCFMEQLLKAEDYNELDHARTESDVSPKVALQYFAAHDVNYYVSYAKGYKSGGFNSLSFTGTHPAPQNPGDPAEHTLEYKPEHGQTWELGAKGRFFDGTLEVNVTGYRTEFQNLQVLAFNGVFFDVSNAGRAHSNGLELDFRWLTPWEPLRINGSAGLLDARYDEYPGAPAPISQGIGVKQDLGGQRIAFAPRETGTLTPTLTFLIGNYITSFAVDALYQGDQYTDTDLDPNVHQPAYMKYAARLSFGAAGGLWNLGIGGTNLTDERVLNQVTDAPFFPGTYFAQEASGRQLFGTLAVHF